MTQNQPTSPTAREYNFFKTLNRLQANEKRNDSQLSETRRSIHAGYDSDTSISVSRAVGNTMHKSTENDNEMKMNKCVDFNQKLVTIISPKKCSPRNSLKKSLDDLEHTPIHHSSLRNWQKKILRLSNSHMWADSLEHNINDSRHSINEKRSTKENESPKKSSAKKLFKKTGSFRRSRRNNEQKNEDFRNRGMSKHFSKESESPENLPIVKVVVWGAKGVGKTSLIHQLMTNNFREAYTPTTSDIYRWKNLEIWDVGEIEEFSGMKNLLLSWADVFLLVFSLNKDPNAKCFKATPLSPQSTIEKTEESTESENDVGNELPKIFRKSIRAKNRLMRTLSTSSKKRRSLRRNHLNTTKSLERKSKECFEEKQQLKRQSSLKAVDLPTLKESFNYIKIVKDEIIQYYREQHTRKMIDWAKRNLAMHVTDNALDNALPSHRNSSIFAKQKFPIIIVGNQADLLFDYETDDLTPNSTPELAKLDMQISFDWDLSFIITAANRLSSVQESYNSICSTLNQMQFQNEYYLQLTQNKMKKNSIEGKDLFHLPCRDDLESIGEKIRKKQVKKKQTYNSSTESMEKNGRVSLSDNNIDRNENNLLNCIIS
ncbi:hypothetical protein SNEBB_001142 [Seison nebaliae]|nr:hypothetical protein SNEBB_001142 [Seison nebaliae]